MPTGVEEARRARLNGPWYGVEDPERDRWEELTRARQTHRPGRHDRRLEEFPTDPV
jgi:hypothetical protein